MIRPRRSGSSGRTKVLLGDGYRLSQVVACLARSSTYLLTEAEAGEIVDSQTETIEREWASVCELAQLSEADRRRLWHGAVLNPYATEGYPR